MKTLVMMIVLATALIFAGCTAKDTLTVVVQKTYSLVVKAEAIVINASPENFAKMASTIDTSLGYVNVALTFASTKVTNPSVLETIKKAQESIVKVQTALKTLTPETLAETKVLVVNSLETMKSAVASVASYFNIPLPVTKAYKVSANADPAKELQDATDDLSKVLPKK